MPFSFDQPPQTWLGLLFAIILICVFFFAQAYMPTLVEGCNPPCEETPILQSDTSALVMARRLKFPTKPEKKSPYLDPITIQYDIPVGIDSATFVKLRTAKCRERILSLWPQKSTSRLAKEKLKFYLEAYHRQCDYQALIPAEIDDAFIFNSETFKYDSVNDKMLATINMSIDLSKTSTAEFQKDAYVEGILRNSPEYVNWSNNPMGVTININIVLPIIKNDSKIIEDYCRIKKDAKGEDKTDETTCSAFFKSGIYRLNDLQKDVIKQVYKRYLTLIKKHPNTSFQILADGYSNEKSVVGIIYKEDGRWDKDERILNLTSNAGKLIGDSISSGKMIPNLKLSYARAYSAIRYMQELINEDAPELATRLQLVYRGHRPKLNSKSQEKERKITFSILKN